MTADELKAVQAPLKSQYRARPEGAIVLFRAAGTIRSESLSCDVETRGGSIHAGLHPAAGGDGSWACSADMLLQALVACAGVTVAAVATALAIPLRGGRVVAEGEIDFRGTLGLSKEAPVGFRSIRLSFALDADAPPDQLDKLIELAERYCVIYQTLRTAPSISVQRL